MSYQDKPKGYMQTLDEWSERVIIEPLVHACTYGPDEAVSETKQTVLKAIREKVLESYHNGQDAKGKQKRYAAR
jgi:hypothetical protein